MSENHYSLQYSAENFGEDIMRIDEPFSESQRSKSQEHENRLTGIEKTQKIAKNEENQS